MDFETFSFRDFFNDLGSCLNWFKNIFTLDTPFFYNPLIFIIFGFAIIFFIAEEIIGLITEFRFGGWIIRPFRAFFVRPVQPFESGFNSEFINNYDKLEKPKKFFAMRNPKYFVSYKNRLFPVYNKRYLSKYQSAGFKVLSANALKSYNINSVRSFSGSGGKGFSTVSKGSLTGSNSYNPSSAKITKIGVASMNLNNFVDTLDNGINKLNSNDDDYVSVSDLDESGDNSHYISAPSNLDSDEWIDRIIEEEYLAGLEAGEYD